ncbi:anti-sigma factor antagonist [Sphaerisporangium album]|uniref:Anti-sigma factor antagonist n=1 Tax=Sphaerisporangium album TaxID=509200 RepID=A0A367FNJ3_9ACTN|nr:STAS domain-containing protein [Sphaerisporangium album]RCG31804.1 anti-sigma factor antagonist [Sphaerisporangium album]
MVYPARETGLEIQQRHVGACTVVEIAGELDMYAVPRLRATLDLALKARRPPCLVLDLGRAAFCDSLGLGLLVSTLNRVREAGGRLALVVGPGMISRLLAITNLDHHFETYATCEEAVAVVEAA